MRKFILQGRLFGRSHYSQLIDLFQSYIKEEETSMMADTIYGACAANHRGAIRAYKLVIEKMTEFEPTVKKVDHTESNASSN